jgi:DNA/RNA-binding domain of Phe-tRNA-synthetase-like protein
MDKHALMLIISDAWKRAYPGASIGILAMRNVSNPEHHSALDSRKAELENELRAQFSGRSKKELGLLRSIQPYVTYYGRFKKTYHVQLQLESVALKGKPIPRAAALVEAMFMAELKNQLLTAGHDLESIQLPVRLDVAAGSESYTLLNGQTQILKAGDMMMADAQGVISSVLYGPDERTRITHKTRQALFAVYAPPGIAEQDVHRHLDDIRANILLIAPEAAVEMLEIFGASGGQK